MIVAPGMMAEYQHPPQLSLSLFLSLSLGINVI
jgi:hypothetical protein